QVIVQPAEPLLNPLMKVHQRLVLADLDRARHSLEVLESSIETQDRRHRRKANTAQRDPLGLADLLGVAEQVGDDVAGLLALGLGNTLESLRVLSFDADEDPQLCVRVALVNLDMRGSDRRQLGVEVARLGVRICPRIRAHRYLTSLRSASVAAQPVMISHVAGSIVASMTRVRLRPPSV